MNLITLLILYGLLTTAKPFLLDDIIMTEDTFDECSTCDSRADRTCNREVANALRSYIKGKDIKLAIESGDVMVSEGLPNQKINTGSSCSKTAEARNGRVTAKMVDGESAELDGHVFTEFDNAIMSGTVPHEVTLTANVQVKFGFRLLGKCKQWEKKTCGIEGSSKGNNDIEVLFAASECSTSIIDGKEHVQFLLDVVVRDTRNITTYEPMTIPKGKNCNILGGLASINSYIKKYGDRFLDSQQGKIVELRGPKLVKKLEDVLKAKLGTTVILPVNIVPIPIGFRRRKRSASAQIPGCKRKKCPDGFNRVKNSEICVKFMKMSLIAQNLDVPDCTKFGKDVKLAVIKRKHYQFYWCYTTMS